MNEKDKMEPVPYRVHEEALARDELKFKRLWILCIIIFAALIGTNAGWIVHESMYEDVVTTVTQEATAEGGDVTIYGENAGAVFYGDSEADSND